VPASGTEAVLELQFNVLFKGDDWRGTEKGRRLEEDFAPFGVEIHYFPYTMHTSSSQLRRVLSAMDAEPMGQFG